MENKVTITLGSQEQAEAVAAVVSSKKFREKVNDHMDINQPEGKHLNLYKAPERDGNDVDYDSEPNKEAEDTEDSEEESSEESTDD